jgi:hypothetical protein
MAYHLLWAPPIQREPHKFSQPYTVALKEGDISEQSSYFWNHLAPLADDVSLRVSRKDFSKERLIPADRSEVSRSVLLHEARDELPSFSLLQAFYQVVLLISAAIVLKCHVAPLFHSV